MCVRVRVGVRVCVCVCVRANESRFGLVIIVCLKTFICVLFILLQYNLNSRPCNQLYSNAPVQSCASAGSHACQRYGGEGCFICPKITHVHKLISRKKYYTRRHAGNEHRNICLRDETQNV